MPIEARERSGSSGMGFGLLRFFLPGNGCENRCLLSAMPNSEAWLPIHLQQSHADIGIMLLVIFHETPCNPSCRRGRRERIRHMSRSVPARSDKGSGAPQSAVPRYQSLAHPLLGGDNAKIMTQIR